MSPAIRLLAQVALAATLLAIVPADASSGGLRRVLILASFGPDVAPFRTISASFRTEVAQLCPDPVEFLDVSLETARFESADETPVIEYVRAILAKRNIDLVVANGGPATRFWLRHRGSLLAAAIPVIAVVEERQLKGLPLSPGDAAVLISVDVPGLLRHILEVLPDTREVWVVVGNSPLEKFWLAVLQEAWQPFSDRVRITFMNDLPFQEQLRKSAALPPHSVLFYLFMLVDAAGVPYGQETAIGTLHAAANAPVFGWSDDLLGHGIVGGPLLPLSVAGHKAALAAQRLFSGPAAAAVERSTTGAAPPAYDWRELQRWGIEEGRLPPGSRILFRRPSVLKEYRWPILASLGVIAAQALAIAGFLVAHRRRRQAEAEARNLRQELARAGRISIIGRLASSLAHELNQPLGAILRNAEAADLLLDATPPDLAEVRAILSDIRNDDHRAGSVIDGIRSLLRRHEVEMTLLGPGSIVESVAALVRSDAQARGVSLAVDIATDLPRIRGNAVQLQQVLLNLMINGMEAMDSSAGRPRALAVCARPLEGGEVEVAVSDSGPGIPAEDVEKIFENFYTTKPGGMGMGLSICRDIVAAHGGRVHAENRAGGGAVLRIVLPVEQGAR